MSDIFVRNISMNNAQNGARIKVFPGSNDTKSIAGGGSGYVRNVTFEDFVCISEFGQGVEDRKYISQLITPTDCDNPILLDQCYNYDDDPA